MATERIQIIVSSKGTVTVKREIEEIGTAAKRSNNGVDLLRSGLGLLTAAFSFGAIIKYADAGIRLENSLKVAGLAGEALATTQDRLYATALRNGQNAEALAAVYQKTSLVQKELGISGEGVIEAVEGIAAAMKLSTAGTSAQEGALQQLSQLMGGSIVQAQEYNSLIDGAFPLVQAAAHGIDNMGGSVAKLTQAIKAGGFSSRVFFEGMMKGLQDTKALAESLPLTIGQSIVNLQTSFSMLLKWINETTGGFSYFAMAINFVALNLGIFALALTPLIAGLILFAGQAVIGAAIAGITALVATITTVAIPAIVAFNAVLWANPYLLIAAGIAAVIAAIIYWRKELGITDKLLKRIWAVGVAVWEAIAEAAIAGWNIIRPLFDAWLGLWKEIFNLIEDQLFPVLKALWSWMEPVLSDAYEGWKIILGVLTDIATFVGGKFFAVLKDSFEGIILIIKSVIDVVTSLINKFKLMISFANKALGGGGSGKGAGAGGSGGAGGAAGFATGGQFMVGGTGSGTDTTPVRFNANRGERVTVETRKQQRNNDNQRQAANTEVKVPVAITNVFDPSMIPTAVESASGQHSIINVIKHNREEILRILGTG